MTDTLGRMHSDAQFAGSSSVPAHVEMMGFLGMGNNPMVGASVAIAVAIDLALNKKQSSSFLEDLHNMTPPIVRKGYGRRFLLFNLKNAAGLK